MAEDATRVLFVDAGVRALIQQPRQVLERGLRSEDIVNQANASQATFFRKFSTKSEFIEAVVAKLTEAERSSVDTVRDDVLARMKANEGNLRPTVISLVADSFANLTDEAITATDSLARVFGNTYAIKSNYARRDALVLAVFEALFERSDAALRRPFTTRTLAMSVVALLDGFRIRSSADPAAVTADVVSDAILALLSSTVDTSGGHEHLDDMVEPIEGSAPRAVPRDPRAAIIAAARTEFGKRGYFMTRLDDIADDAGVPRDAMKRLFPTKPHILVAALQSRVDALRESVADDLLIGLDELTIMNNFLLRCAQLAADENAFMDALLVAVAHDTYGEPEGLLSVKQKLNIPAIIGPIIQQGQDNGTLAPIGTPVDLAAGITNTLLMRCFTRRNVSPEENATFIGNLLLRGLSQ
ncbi:TetR/AcrR family transcriptional regulator [Rhodococcus sp. P1Y]|uniref:TetR/AcrR family transcriptional regulator n=1 Tax=Rhodococcus sp. P1Y TaxID=1302308 RepID=UPI000EAC9671|nr:TetR/AcrR family transcriptional regulator [Rhodococcus sp. P1Y]AYJ50469.1 TetR/AcrR family transcriptional regulator [Rhodococcus sp. P1Y]